MCKPNLTPKDPLSLSHKRQCPSPSTSGSGSSSESSVDGSNNKTTSPRRNSNRRRRRGRGTKQLKLQKAFDANILAMDCEMVGVGEEGRQSALARVVIVDWNGALIYDAYVKQVREVTDYRTFVSGITAEHLENGIPLQQCQTEVAAILTGKTVVGHHLKNDFKALGIQHSWDQMRDTAKYQPFQKTRPGYGDTLWPRKLKDLSAEYLQRDIQAPGQAHCPREDAVAALDLYKSVRVKFEKVMEYKINKTRQINLQNMQNGVYAEQ